MQTPTTSIGTTGSLWNVMRQLHHMCAALIQVMLLYYNFLMEHENFLLPDFMGFHKLIHFEGTTTVEYWSETNSVTECLATCFGHDIPVALVLEKHCLCGEGKVNNTFY